jgi:hypothetical protein
MKQPNNELLIDYLDGKLSPEENSELEFVLQEDKNTSIDLEYLKLALDTVRLNAITGKVNAVRQSIMATPANKISVNRGTVRTMYRNVMRIAAIVVLTLGLASVYKYTSVNSQSVYKNQFIPYDLSITRGGEDRVREDEAYSDKNWNEVVAIFHDQKLKSNKSIFLAGVAEMQLQHYSQAEVLFQQILAGNSADSSFQEEAEYYCALTCLMNHEETKGINLINKIKSDTNHRYYPIASKITGIDLKIINLKK